MATTPALPLGLSQYALAYVPRAVGARVIPRVMQPDFGIVPNSVIPGSVALANAFYNAALDYYNRVQEPLPPTNMPVNQYLGYIPGISRAPQP